jgi:SAM-dependent methyltransferase
MQAQEWLIRGKSYLSEVPLESVDSKISQRLHVSMIRGRLQLTTDHVIYSWEDLYRNFRYASNRVNWKKFRPKNVLVLGLGLGSVIQILERKVTHPLSITAVELDEGVLYLAKKYSASKFRSPIQYLCADAYAFVQQNRQKFDLILFDIFVDDYIPSQFESLAFTQKLASSLAPGGLILYNRIAMEPAQIMQNMEFYDQAFSKVFPEAEILQIKTNWVFASNKHLLKS